MKDKKSFVTLEFYTDKDNIQMCADSEGRLFVGLRNIDNRYSEDARDCFNLQEQQAIELRDFLNYAYPKKGE